LTRLNRKAREQHVTVGPCGIKENAENISEDKNTMTHMASKLLLTTLII
jgi:hypothetical protein